MTKGEKLQFTLDEYTTSIYSIFIGRKKITKIIKDNKSSKQQISIYMIKKDKEITVISISFLFNPSYTKGKK